MNLPLRIATAVLAVLLLGFGLLHTGLARQAFFALFSYVKGVDVLSPTVTREPPVDPPYERWLQQARGELPMFEGLVIEDVGQIALRPWPQMGDGVSGLYLRFADYQMNDGRILQIPAGRRTAAQRHLYEKAVYVIGGSGYTEVRQQDRPADRIEWAAGDLFSIPLNVVHRHHAAADGPARLLAITSFPLMLNVMDDADFVTDNPYAFYGRYNGEAGYFNEAENDGGLQSVTSYVDDIRSTETHAYDYLGEGVRTMRWDMANNSMLSMHIGEIPPRRYQKAHRHSSEALILVLSGQGFSLAWPEGAYHKRMRVDWRPGTLFLPPTFWYHQHLNTGPTSARRLAINSPALVRNIGLRFADQLEVDLDEVRAEFERALAERSEGAPESQ